MNCTGSASSNNCHSRYFSNTGPGVAPNEPKFRKWMSLRSRNCDVRSFMGINVTIYFIIPKHGMKQEAERHRLK